ncbi:MAG: hypothetical protein SFT93_02175 [Rickettsiaceae bacterium]|nr:hypothetical protein [Rickettsiaceae bacterium]
MTKELPISPESADLLRKLRDVSRLNPDEIKKMAKKIMQGMNYSEDVAEKIAEDFAASNQNRGPKE